MLRSERDKKRTTNRGFAMAVYQNPAVIAEKPHVTFGLITDVQYADVDDAPDFSGTRRRYYRNSLVLLKNAVNEWKRQADHVAFVLQLGDIIDGKNRERGGEAAAQAALAAVLGPLASLNTPVYHTVGNHELYNFPRAFFHGFQLSRGLAQQWRHGTAPPDPGNTPRDNTAASTPATNPKPPPPHGAHAPPLPPPSHHSILTPAGFVDLTTNVTLDFLGPGAGPGALEGLGMALPAAAAALPPMATPAGLVGLDSPKGGVGAGRSRAGSFSAWSGSAAGGLHYTVLPHPGLRVVCLDAFDLSLLGHQDHQDASYTDAMKLFRQHNKNEDGNDTTGLTGLARRWAAYNGGVGTMQLAWLTHVLHRAQERKENVLVTSHVPLHPCAAQRVPAAHSATQTNAPRKCSGDTDDATELQNNEPPGSPPKPQCKRSSAPAAFATIPAASTAATQHDALPKEWSCLQRSAPVLPTVATGPGDHGAADGPPALSLLWNYQEVLDVIHQHKCVVGVVAGHAHDGGSGEDEDGTPHITLQGVVETAPGGDCYCTARLWSDALVLTGAGRVTSHRLPLRYPVHYLKDPPLGPLPS